MNQDAGEQITLKRVQDTEGEVEVEPPAKRQKTEEEHDVSHGM